MLEMAGHDVVWAGEWAEDPGDDEILAQANREGRVLVTIDKDFGELAIVRGLPHSGIVRLAGLRTDQQGTVCLRVLALYGQELQQGAIVTAGVARARIRPPDTGRPA